jgi:UrcA family protein
MNTQSIISRRFRGRYTAAIFTALFGIVPLSTIADQPAAPTPVSRVAEVALSDLDLSTPEGMHAARDRLHAMAQRVCTAPLDGRGPSPQPNVVACVDSTVAAALRQIAALRRVNFTVHDSVTRAATVSLADLDLSTLQGSRAAYERLETMARRLCTELSHSHGLSYQPNYDACVHDTLVGALAQANVLAADKNTRTARRSEP